MPAHRPAKTWIKISIECAPAMSDAAAAFLAGFTGGGVEISPGGAAGNSSPREKVIGYLEAASPVLGPEQQSELQAFLHGLTENFPTLTPPVLDTGLIAEQDWSEGWKRHFTAFRITPRLLIKPSWEDYQQPEGTKAPAEVVIEMDPGLAFGTGHHDSTRLALTLIDEHFASAGPTLPRQVLDAGCGTGILAMACARFGAESVLAVDNDPDAVAVARDNVARNGLAAMVQVSGEDIVQLTTPFDMIVANIVHDVLRDLAPALCRLLAPAGTLILAGILKGSQEQSLAGIYGSHGLELTETRASNEWVAMVFRRTGLNKEPPFRVRPTTEAVKAALSLLPRPYY